MTGRWLLFTSAFLFLAASAVFGQEVPAAAPVATAFTFTGKDAKDMMAPVLAGAGAGVDVKVEIAGMRDDDTLATSSTPITAQVDGLTLDNANSRWEATLLLKAGSRNLAPLKIAGRYDEMKQVPVLLKRMQPGDVIGQSDISWQEQAANRLPQSTIVTADNLVGKAPRHVISPNRPIRLDEVSNPPIINRGARITLLYHSQNLEIKTLGEAMDSGAKGEVIRVRNVVSKAVIEGTVQNSECVKVSAPEDVSAEAM